MQHDTKVDGSRMATSAVTASNCSAYKAVSDKPALQWLSQIFSQDHAAQMLGMLPAAAAADDIAVAPVVKCLGHILLGRSQAAAAAAAARVHPLVDASKTVQLHGSEIIAAAAAVAPPAYAATDDLPHCHHSCVSCCCCCC
jgi:hypothetical protein